MSAPVADPVGVHVVRLNPLPDLDFLISYENEISWSANPFTRGGGGTLIFSYIRRLGSFFFFLFQKFELQFFFIFIFYFFFFFGGG